MLFNAAQVLAVAGLAGLAQAAPWPANAVGGQSSSSSTSSSSTSTIASTHISYSLPTSSSTKSMTSTIGGVPAPSNPPANLPAALAATIGKQMLTELTAVDRFVDLLAEDPTAANKTLLKDPKEIEKRIVFDFNAAPTGGKGGRILVANQKNFPILTEIGISGAVAFLNPCSMNSPHSHPRASELLTLVQGDKLQTGMMIENGFAADASQGKLTTQISAELSQYQATVFPQGSIHFQFNPTCEPAVFVAALTSSDPGTNQVAQNFFFEDENIVSIALGEPKELNGKNLDSFRGQIPSNLVQAMETCMSACKAKGY